MHVSSWTIATAMVDSLPVVRVRVRVRVGVRVMVRVRVRVRG